MTTHNQQFSSHHSLLSIAHRNIVCHDSQSTVHITLYYPFHTAPQFVTTHNQQFASLFTIHCTQKHSLSRLTINSSHHSLLSIAHSTTVCHDSQSAVHITLYYSLHTACHDSQSAVHITLYYPLHTVPQRILWVRQGFTSLVWRKQKQQNPSHS